MYTYPNARFYFTDVSARPDSRPSSRQNQSFAELNLFKDDVHMRSYGTLEPNQFILDGSLDIFPDAPEDIPFWSLKKSGIDGSFEQNPGIEINFTQRHSSAGLTLYFADDFPEKVRIIWYTLHGTELDRGDFYPDSAAYYCGKRVSNYSRIVIEFITTSWPERYIKMNAVEYGRIWDFSRENIREASVYEETDLTGATLAVNTAKVVIIDQYNDFDMTKKDGLWKYLQKNQSIRLTENIDGRAVDCGTFYLESWEVQQNVVTFSLTDLIGKMDKSLFYDGEVYHQVSAGQVIGAIMDSCGVENYSVEDEVAQCLLSGWLAIQTHREALQQAVFACAAVVERSRAGGIRIYRPDRHVSRSIGLERKFLGTQITLDEYVSGVSIGYVQYELEPEKSEISKEMLPPGVSVIELSEPCQPESIEVSQGTVLRAGVNYVEVSMPSEAECVVAGRKYQSTEHSYTARITVPEPGETENIKSFSGCTMMDSRQAKETAERILQHYQFRQLAEINYVNDGEAAGDWCSVAQLGGRYYVTCITGQSLDLTGGNRASAKCRGYSREVTDFCFAGEGMYAGNPLYL